MNKFEAFLAMARSMHRDLGYSIGQAYYAALIECDPGLAMTVQVQEFPLDPLRNDDAVPELLIQVFRAWKKEDECRPKAV